jgi:hypothetical protein
MAFVADLPTNYNILSPVGYRLYIPKLPTVSYFCQSANIPDVSLGMITRSNPVRDYPEPGDQLELGSFDISFLVDEDLTNYLEILTWLREISGTPNSTSFGRLGSEDSGYGTVTDITLTILTNSMNANKSVYFTDCFPTSLGAISLMSNTESIDAITCDVSFSYVDFIIKDET